MGKIIFQCVLRSPETFSSKTFAFLHRLAKILKYCFSQTFWEQMHTFSWQYKFSKAFSKELSGRKNIFIFLRARESFSVERNIFYENIQVLRSPLNLCSLAKKTLKFVFYSSVNCLLIFPHHHVHIVGFALWCSRDWILKTLLIKPILFAQKRCKSLRVSTIPLCVRMTSTAIKIISLVIFVLSYVTTRVAVISTLFDFCSLFKKSHSALLL